VDRNWCTLLLHLVTQVADVSILTYIKSHPLLLRNLVRLAPKNETLHSILHAFLLPQHPIKWADTLTALHFPSLLLDAAIETKGEERERVCETIIAAIRAPSPLCDAVKEEVAPGIAREAFKVDGGSLFSSSSTFLPILLEALEWSRNEGDYISSKLPHYPPLISFFLSDHGAAVARLVDALEKKEGVLTGDGERYFGEFRLACVKLLSLLFCSNFAALHRVLFALDAPGAVLRVMMKHERNGVLHDVGREMLENLLYCENFELSSEWLKKSRFVSHLANAAKEKERRAPAALEYWPHLCKVGLKLHRVSMIIPAMAKHLEEMEEWGNVLFPTLKAWEKENSGRLLPMM